MTIMENRCLNKKRMFLVKINNVLVKFMNIINGCNEKCFK